MFNSLSHQTVNKTFARLSCYFHSIDIISQLSKVLSCITSGP